MSTTRAYEERLAEMNRLAQKIWPNDKAEVFYCPFAMPVPNAWVERIGRVEFGIDHEHALPALHAALLVMTSGNEAALFDSGRRFEHASAWYTWQEQLARDLEVVLQSMGSGIASVPLRACIETLRERGAHGLVGPVVVEGGQP